jgi:hypothetical protein
MTLLAWWSPEIRPHLLLCAHINEVEQSECRVLPKTEVNTQDIGM